MKIILKFLAQLVIKGCLFVQMNFKMTGVSLNFLGLFYLITSKIIQLKLVYYSSIMKIYSVYWKPEINSSN